MAVPLATPIKAAALLKKQFPCPLKIRWVAPSPLQYIIIFGTCVVSDLSFQDDLVNCYFDDH